MKQKLPHNRTWYFNKLATIAKKCAKERDGYVCQMCEKECVGSDAHGSHIDNVGAHKNMALDPVNIKCLCSYCHLHRWHKDPREWGPWFNRKFPERALYLDGVKKLNLRIETVELAELYEKVRGANGWKVYANEYMELIKRKTNQGA